MKKLICVFLVLMMVSGAFASVAALAADEDTASLLAMPASAMDSDPIATEPPADDKVAAAIEDMPDPIAAAPADEKETVAIGAEPVDETTVVAIGAEAGKNTVAIGAESQFGSASARQKDSVPKTGEADHTMILLPMFLFGITGMVVFGKQRSLYESV